MILFAHTKFGLVRIQESRVKRGGGRNPPPRSERVFQIPVQIGLTWFNMVSHLSFLSLNLMDYTSEAAKSWSRNDPICDPWDSQGNEKIQFLFLLLFGLTFWSEIKIQLPWNSKQKTVWNNIACRASYKPSKLEGHSEIGHSFIRVWPWDDFLATRKLDHFFYASHVHHNFPYKFIPISMC